MGVDIANRYTTTFKLCPQISFVIEVLNGPQTLVIVAGRLQQIQLMRWCKKLNVVGRVPDSQLVLGLDDLGGGVVELTVFL